MVEAAVTTSIQVTVDDSELDGTAGKLEKIQDQTIEIPATVVPSPAQQESDAMVENLIAKYESAYDDLGQDIVGTIDEIGSAIGEVVAEDEVSGIGSLLEGWKSKLTGLGIAGAITGTLATITATDEKLTALHAERAAAIRSLGGAAPGEEDPLAGVADRWREITEAQEEARDSVWDVTRAFVTSIPVVGGFIDDVIEGASALSEELADVDEVASILAGYDMDTGFLAGLSSDRMSDRQRAIGGLIGDLAELEAAYEGSLDVPRRFASDRDLADNIDRVTGFIREQESAVEDWTRTVSTYLDALGGQAGIRGIAQEIAGQAGGRETEWSRTIQAATADAELLGYEILQINSLIYEHKIDPQAGWAQVFGLVAENAAEAVAEAERFQQTLDDAEQGVLALADTVESDLVDTSLRRMAEAMAVDRFLSPAEARELGAELRAMLQAGFISEETADAFPGFVESLISGAEADLQARAGEFTATFTGIMDQVSANFDPISVVSKEKTVADAQEALDELRHKIEHQREFTEFAEGLGYGPDSEVLQQIATGELDFEDLQVHIDTEEGRAELAELLADIEELQGASEEMQIDVANLLDMDGFDDLWQEPLQGSLDAVDLDTSSIEAILGEGGASGGEQFSTNMLSEVDYGMDGVTAQVEFAMGGLVGTAAATGTEVGAAFAAGISAGISGAAAGVAAEAAATVAAAAAAARAQLSIFSPSGVGIEIGQAFDEGIAIGIGQGRAVEAAAGIGDTIVNVTSPPTADPQVWGTVLGSRLAMRRRR